MTTDLILAKQTPFGISDYWRMYKARGIRLPVNYFLQSHLFDLAHGTDTHRRLREEEFENPPPNFEHATPYMCSWTSEIRRSFRAVRNMLGNEFENYSFVDIGCGKGKVLLVWEMECVKEKIAQAVYGIEFYEPFIDIAKRNHRAVFNDDGHILCRDAANTDFGEFGDKVIVCLYNTFDAFMLEKVLTHLARYPSIVIYHYPVHAKVLRDFEYAIAYEHMGFHPNAQTMVFSNRAVA